MEAILHITVKPLDTCYEQIRYYTIRNSSDIKLSKIHECYINFMANCNILRRLLC